ncbi:MAG: c-type cytochrome, partial [Pirellulales bacterium]
LASSSAKSSTSSMTNADAMASLLGTYGYDDWFQRVAGMVDEEQMDAILASMMNPSQTHLSGPNMDRVLAALVTKASSRYRTEILNSLKGTSQRPDWHFVLAAGLRRNHSQELDPQVYGSIVKDARSVLDAVEAVASTQLAALQFLVQQPVDELKQDQGRMLQVLKKETQQEGVLVALEGLKRLNDPSIAEQFLMDWDAYAPSMQSILGNAIVTNKSWFPALVRSLERNAISISKLDPRVLEHMQTIADDDLRQRCEKLLAAQGKSEGEEIQRFLMHMPAQGNPEKGQVLFQRHCQICHSEAAQKVSVGPSLAGFSKWSDTMWVTAILEPNRAVEVRYRRWTLLTEEDEVIVGLLKNESNEDVTIVSPEGKHTTVVKQQIQKLEESDRSLMPEGFGRYFSPQDMRNLLSFLQRMGGGLNEVSQ